LEVIVANSPQARKRARQADKRRLANTAQRSTMRTAIKNVIKACADGDYDNAKACFIKAQSNLDNFARKGLIAKNKASRLKSRLNSRVKALATAA
jgi:small subunit ribosomal protein S20